jgi:DNA polymerase III subunit gamma/tau
MSLALYRKYRPATFAELKGQEHVAEPLQQALRNGRVNHAYLFSGPRGCGKTSSARILARSLNCEQGPTPDPCGLCDSCVALGPGGSGSLDVIEIDAASHGGVDDARDLRERAFFAPVSSRFKIYIIDEAHMVTREGFNALLKLVEEPPPHLKFVFATTEPEKVIGTIRSRTHHYPFRLIPPKVLQELLEEILGSENVPYEPAALPLVVRAGAGSARDSLSILDQLLAGSDEAGITYARAVSLLGFTDSALLDDVIDAFAARDGAAVFASIDRIVESGQDPRRFTADLLGRFRDLVILSNVPEATKTGLISGPADELDHMVKQSTAMGAGELTRAADLLNTGLTEMRGATSPRLLLELICARILLPSAYGDESALFARLDRLEKGGFAVAQPADVQSVPVSAPPAYQAPARQQAPAPQVPAPQAPARQAPQEAPAGTAYAQQAPAAQAPRPRQAPQSPPTNQRQQGPPPQQAPPAQQIAPAAGGAVDLATVKARWQQILGAVGGKSRVAGIYMAGVEVVSFEGTLLTVSFPNENNRKAFATRDAVLREVLRETFGLDLRVDAVLAGSVSSRQPAAAPQTAPLAATTWEPVQQPPAAAPPKPAPVKKAPEAWAPSPTAPAPDLPPPPDGPTDESDEVDLAGDAQAPDEGQGIGGVALIQRELGAQVIREIDGA